MTQNNNANSILSTDQQIKLVSDVSEIAANIKNLVVGNSKQDQALEEAKAEIKEVREDVKKHRSFIDKFMGIIVVLVFLVPAFEAFVVYKSLDNNPETATIKTELVISGVG